MFGVAMIAGAIVRVDTRCGDCGEPITLDCAPAAPPNGEGIVHFLLSARRWTTDRGYEVGATLDLPRVWRLAKDDPRVADWRPRTRDENQAVLASVGLSGEFWELPR